MGHKVNAVGMRIGINRDWNSKWFASKADYGNFIVEDMKIRGYLEKELKNSMLSKVVIERVKTDKGHNVNVKIYCSRPGEVLGQEGENKKRLLAELNKLLKIDSAKDRLDLNVVNILNPDLDATLVAKWIASELENRAAFRSTMKKAIQRMRKAGAKGCKTLCSGRLGGAEIARAEGYKEGVVPLHTIRADIDFAHVDAATTYGRIGVKVWICRSLSKIGTEEVNEPAPRDSRPSNRDDRRRGNNKGGMNNNAATKAR